MNTPCEFLQINLDNDYSLNYSNDHTGMTSYTLEQKSELLKTCLEMASKNIYECNFKPIDQKLQNIDNRFTKTKAEIENVKIIKAMIYNLYMFGTFKWGRYILVDRKLDNNQEKHFYLDTQMVNLSHGVLQSVLSKEISDFASQYNQLENNLLKLVKKHGYDLRDSSKKKSFFGKGHLNLTGMDKISAKNDLNLIFNLMNQSKKIIKEEGVFKKIDFPLDSFKYFILYKVR